MHSQKKESIWTSNETFFMGRTNEWDEYPLKISNFQGVPKPLMVTNKYAYTNSYKSLCEKWTYLVNCPWVKTNINALHFVIFKWELSDRVPYHKSSTIMGDFTWGQLAFHWLFENGGHSIKIFSVLLIPKSTLNHNFISAKPQNVVTPFFCLSKKSRVH